MCLVVGRSTFDARSGAAEERTALLTDHDRSSGSWPQDLDQIRASAPCPRRAAEVTGRTFDSLAVPRSEMPARPLARPHRTGLDLHTHQGVLFHEHEVHLGVRRP